MVSFKVFGEQNQVTSYVAFVGMSVHIGIGNVCLTPEDRLEQLAFLVVQVYFEVCDNIGVRSLFRLLFFELFLNFLYSAVHIRILFVDIVMQFFYAKHVAMVGESNAAHAVGYSLIDNALYWCLAIEQRVL